LREDASRDEERRKARRRKILERLNSYDAGPDEADREREERLGRERESERERALDWGRPGNKFPFGP
jgi:hypothetical protein